jgi:hypothetical protein
MMQIKINSLIVGESPGAFWKFHYFQKSFCTPCCSVFGFNKLNLIFNRASLRLWKWVVREFPNFQHRFGMEIGAGAKRRRPVAGEGKRRQCDIKNFFKLFLKIRENKTVLLSIPIDELLNSTV